MKKRFITCLLIITSVLSFAQDSEVVHHQVSFTQDSAHVVMTITLAIDSSWIVYDSIAGEDGPIPFSILLEDPSIATIESIIKPKRHKKHDELFEMDIYYLKGTVRYVIKFSKNVVNSTGLLAGSYELMSCNLSSGVCLPPAQHSFSCAVGPPEK
ncbi:MAG: hypothetical protein ACJA0Q_001253 [Saprospiraceae bacterium]|jgi:hypothetical protein